MAGSRATVGEPHNTRPDLLLHGEPTNVRISYFDPICARALGKFKMAACGAHLFRHWHSPSTAAIGG